MNLAVVRGILAGIGLIMFLLPPVLGVHIYLTIGFVIISVGRGWLGIFGSIIYALVLSLCLKLLACAMQQQGIGGLLQHIVSVRQLVGVNKRLIRAMKLVLREKGLEWPMLRS